jgi:hypothetical protein
MIRKHAVMAIAMLGFGLMVASPAQAGGTSGAAGVKKTATVRVRNASPTPYYVLVLPNSLAASTQFGTPGTLGWAKKLGGVLVNPGVTIPYPVPAGPGTLYLLEPADLPAKNSAPLPPPAAQEPYNVAKGRVITKTIGSGPIIK